MNLKTVAVQVEDRFLTEQDVAGIWGDLSPEVRGNRMIIAVDGPPGVGKSSFSKILRRRISGLGIDVGLVETDLDCMPWDERPPDIGAMDIHGSTAVEEAVTYPNACFSYTGYGFASHKRDRVVQVYSPPVGVLIVEGLHSVELACRFSRDPVVAVVFEISNELRELRCSDRSVKEGRWRADEAEALTRKYRGPTVDATRDLSRELRRSSLLVRRSLRTVEE